MSGPSTSDLAIAAVGAAIALAALLDVFVTVFNYDGFSFLANRLHGLLWKAMRLFARPLPSRARHAFLSLGSASMLPATYVLWLGLLITGVALMFYAGLRAHGFASHAGKGIGTAFYLSAGDLTSLTFGDVTARSGLMRALVDLETAIGLTTFTLALGYVVTTFGVLRTLDGLHAIVRRHAEDPSKPSSILARHFRGGYYFHTRRLARSIPRVFCNLGHLVALLRCGLPSQEPMSENPLLVALIDEYGTTLERLQRSFVGPAELRAPTPLSADGFAQHYAVAANGGRSDEKAESFRELQRTARSSAGIPAPDGAADKETYRQYREWLPFAHRNGVVLARVADALGYEAP